MYLGNILIGVNDFVMIRSPHVHRHCISHDDLDGYGCSALVKLADLIYTKSTTSKSTDVTKLKVNPIHFHNISKPSSIGSEIESIVEYELKNGFDKEHDILFILITDIGAVNPQIFRDINDDGITCTYAVVDHHIKQYNGESDELEIVVTPDNAISMTRGYYFVYNGLCATYILNDIFERIFNINSELMIRSRFMDPTKQNNSDIAAMLISSELPLRVKDCSECINRYDTGAWGDWHSGALEDVSDDVKTQLVFNFYKNHNILDQFMDDLISSLVDVKNESNWYQKWQEYTREEYISLMHAYNKFIEGSSTFSVPPIVIGQKIPHLSLDINVGCGGLIYIINSEDDELDGYFSLISREAIDKLKVDIVILVDNIDKTVSLRSGENGVNVEKIARANGGGGHIRAAGFPIC